MLEQLQKTAPDAPVAKRRILLVGPEPEARRALATEVAHKAGLHADEVGTAAHAIDAARRRFYEAALVETTLPDMDGRELCRVLRRRKFSAPILLLGAGGSEADIILGLDAGANDYVVKPVKLDVLLARLRAHLRQFARTAHLYLEIGPYLFSPARRELCRPSGGRPVLLTEKETAILRYLYWNGARDVNCDTIMREVWGCRPGLTTHTVQTHIYRLRQKIETLPGAPRLILSTPGFGYRLANHLERGVAA
jgi:DNA-binding response OmpR family regulator